jgi:hypothetical protein
MKSKQYLALCLSASFLLTSTGCATQHASSGDVETAAVTVPQPCPTVNDLQGIEGYAPGAGGAEKTGQEGGGMFGAFAGAAGGKTPAPTKPPSLQCLGLSPDLAAQFDDVSRIASAVPSTGYDPAALAQTLADANAAFTFVRDTIATEAYAGAMRGPSGTLMSGGGSPEDKDTLLAELLAIKHVPARFVHSTLSDADATAIVDAVLAPKPAQPANNAPPAELTARIRTLLPQAVAAADPIQRDLMNRLASSGAALAADDTALRAQLKSNIQDHWWIQAQENGAWVDLDPTLPADAPGTHLGPAPTDEPQNLLPDSRYVTITMRITGDFSSGGTTQTRTLVEKQVKASEAYAQPVLIRIGDRTAANLQASKEYTPAVSVGSNETSGEVFSADDGTTQLQRLQLQIETDRPGLQPLVAQRVLAVRSSAWTPQTIPYEITTMYYGLATGGDIDGGYALERMLERFVAFRDAFEAAGRGDIAGAGVRPIYPVHVLQYFSLDAALRRWLQTQRPNGTRFLFNRPVIAFARATLEPAGTGMRARKEFDVVDDGMNAVGSDMRTARAENLERGIVDDQFETLALGDGGALNTRGVFTVAKRSNIPINVTSAAGTVRIAPAQAVPVNGGQHTGWWEIDTATGSTVGRMDYGAGQALSEYGETVKKLAGTYNEATLMSNTFTCSMNGVSAALSGHDAALQTINCDAVAFCTYMANLLIGMSADAYAVNLNLYVWAQSVFGFLARAANAITKGGGTVCKNAAGA